MQTKLKSKMPFIDPIKAVKSFSFAFQGLWTLITKENNFKIHLLAALVVIVMGLYFSITPGEWLALILFIGLVLIAEAMNTALEVMVDWHSTDLHPMAKKIKDIAAAGVLIAAITAVIGGLIIFWKYVFFFN